MLEVCLMKIFRMITQGCLRFDTRKRSIEMCCYDMIVPLQQQAR